MSRRREAAELARVLALSTQQTRDIADISPHSLSSEPAINTQDSRELQLRIVEMAQPLCTVDDEVHDFSSGSHAGAPVADTIESFTPTRSDADHMYKSTGSTATGIAPPGIHVAPIQSQALSRIAASAITPSSSSGRPIFSPTQTSEPRVPLTTGLPERSPRSDKMRGTTQLPERTPLRIRPSNQHFQLSSSPIVTNALPDVDNGPHPSSELEVVEVKETGGARPAPRSSSARTKLIPGVVLPGKAASRAATFSPDPLDSLSAALSPTKSNEQGPISSLPSAADPTAPASSAIDTGRRSSRVKAAEEKKAKEKEERRRLRKERKAKEEADLNGQTASASSMKQASDRGKLDRRRASVGVDTGVADDHRSVVARKAEESQSSRPNKRVRISIASAASGNASAVVTDANSDGPRGAKADDDEPECPTAIGTSATDQSASPIGSEAGEIRAPQPTLGAEPGRRETTKDSSSRVGGTGSMETPLNDAGPSAAPPATSRAPKGPVVRANDPSTPARHSPGPSNPNGSLSRPGGIKWQTSRTDLSSVLSKFPGSRLTGMSKRHRIAPLHATIGTPVRALPPVPQKPVRKKKADESDEEDDELDKDDKGKGKGLEWFMVED